MLSRAEMAHEVMGRRLSGESAEQIAIDLELRVKDVQALIDEALEQRAEPIEGVRQIELARLETLAATFFEKASRGDARALAAYVKVHDRIAKIAGLHQPQKVNVTHSLGHPMVDAAATYEITPEQIEAALSEYHRQSTNPLGQIQAPEPVPTEDVEDAEIVSGEVVEDPGAPITSGEPIKKNNVWQR